MVRRGSICLPRPGTRRARPALRHAQPEQQEQRTHLFQFIRIQIGEVLLAQGLGCVIRQAYLDLFGLRLSSLMGWVLVLMQQAAWQRCGLTRLSGKPLAELGTI